MRKVIIAIIVVVAIGGAVWYYFGRARHESIEKILSNPGAYEGKVVTIEGEVTDRTAFFVVLKFFKVRDKTGEITVVTKSSLPEVKSTVLVKGRIDTAFPVGDQKLVILSQESPEEKGVNK